MNREEQKYISKSRFILEFKSNQVNETWSCTLSACCKCFLHYLPILSKNMKKKKLENTIWKYSFDADTWDGISLWAIPPPPKTKKKSNKKSLSGTPPPTTTIPHPNSPHMSVLRRVKMPHIVGSICWVKHPAKFLPPKSTNP